MVHTCAYRDISKQKGKRHMKRWHGRQKSVACALVPAAIFLLSGCGTPMPKEKPEEVLGHCDELQGWEVVKAPGRDLHLSIGDGMGRKALYLDYDLGETQLFVIAGKQMLLSLPPNYEFSFHIKGVSPETTSSSSSSMRKAIHSCKVRKNYRFPEDWKKLVVTRRDLRYGWGPNTGAKPAKIAPVESAIAAGQGGAGRIFIHRATLRELPPPKPPMKARPFSEKALEYAAQHAVDDSFATKWRSKPLKAEWLEVDLGKPTPMAGLTLQWTAHGDYDVWLSADAKAGRRVYSQDDADGGLDENYFGKTEARFMKIAGKKLATLHGYQLLEVQIIENRMRV